MVSQADVRLRNVGFGASAGDYIGGCLKGTLGGLPVSASLGFQDYGAVMGAGCVLGALGARSAANPTAPAVAGAQMQQYAPPPPPPPEKGLPGWAWGLIAAGGVLAAGGVAYAATRRRRGK